MVVCSPIGEDAIDSLSLPLGPRPARQKRRVDQSIGLSENLLSSEFFPVLGGSQFRHKGPQLILK